MDVTQLQAPKEDILKRFPEMAPLFAGNCASCVKNRVKATLALKASQGEDMSGIPADWYKGVDVVMQPAKPTGRIEGQPQGGNLSWVQAEPERRECPQCVLKHLSASLVLLDEVDLGYPDHLKYAIRHLEQATIGAQKVDIVKLRHLMAWFQGTKAQELLNRARTDLEELHQKLADPKSTSYWRAIGHMVEAEAECLKHDKSLAEAIRLERVAIMSDPTYKADIKKLLDRLNPEDTVKSAKEDAPQ